MIGSLNSLKIPIKYTQIALELLVKNACICIYVGCVDNLQTELPSEELSTAGVCMSSNKYTRLHRWIQTRIY